MGVLGLAFSILATGGREEDNKEGRFLKAIFRGQTEEMEEEKDIGYENDSTQGDEVAETPVASRPDTAEQLRQQEELEANLARVQFKKAVAKDIVSSHMGSILAKDGPIVPLSAALLEKAKQVFHEMVPELDEDPIEEGEEESTSIQPKQRRMSYENFGKALFDCGVTFINLDELPEPEPEYDDEGEALPVESNPTRVRFMRILDHIAEDRLLGPSNSLDLDGFLYMVSKFYQPQYTYGQRMRRAAGRGCIDDVLDLVVRGIDCNCGDGEGLSTLHYASEFNRVELIQQLIDLCGDRLMLNARCKAGWTPLYTAVHHNNIEVAKLLLNAGADVSIGTVYGKTPLHAAAGQGFVDICAVLLDAEADPNSQCSTGMTPLHDAAYKENIQCYNYLSKHDKTDISIKEALRYTAEKMLCGYTGTNTDGSISYGGSTMVEGEGDASVMSMVNQSQVLDTAPSDAQEEEEVNADD